MLEPAVNTTRMLRPTFARGLVLWDELRVHSRPTSPLIPHTKPSTKIINRNVCVRLLVDSVIWFQPRSSRNFVGFVFSRLSFGLLWDAS